MPLVWVVAISHFKLLLSCYARMEFYFLFIIAGIDFKIRNIRINHDDVKLQIWFVKYFCNQFLY